MPAGRTIGHLVVACAVIAAGVGDVALAEDFEANTQCPPGGTVGQSCKDNTSGYTTQGHCTHISECKADSWPKAPPNDLPKEPQKPMMPPSADMSYIPATTTTSSIPSDVILAAFTEATLDAQAADTPTSTPQIRFVTIKGVKYLVTPDEVLRVGDGLTRTLYAAKTGPNYGEAFKTFAGLSPYMREGSVRAPAKKASDPRLLAPSTFEDGQNPQQTGFDSETISLPVGISITGALVALVLLAIFIALHRSKPAPPMRKSGDPDSLAKHVSTKDESVAMPIITDKQTSTIWDAKSAPHDPMEDAP